MSDLTVTGYRVVVELLPVAERSKGGIYLEAGEALRRKQAAATIGKIVAVGGKAFIGNDFAEGDRAIYPVGTEVIFRQYAGQAYSDNPDDPNATVFRIIADSDVLMPTQKGKKLNFLGD